MGAADPTGDPYAVLKVASTATDREIVLAYRREMAIHHPDRAPADGGARAVLINEAYAILRDPDARAALDYDRRRMAMHTVVGPDQQGHYVRPVHPRPIVPREMRPGAFDPDRREPLNIAWIVMLFAALLTVFLYGLLQNGV
jgi:curved DNA-binding protein CbpA